MGTSTSHDHALGIHHHRTEEMEKPMEEEDHFHKILVQKKQKLDPKIHKSTPTVVQGGLCDSKRHADHFQRGVRYFVTTFCYVTNYLFFFLNIFFCVIS